MPTRSITWPKIELVPITDLRPSAYNPREADPARLELISLSLRKLGWLLPIYADAAGEILSGHQRHHVATTLGFTHVPVVRLANLEQLHRRKAINLLFNRATNDMHQSDTSRSLTDQLERYAATLAMAREWPDLVPNLPESVPCLAATMQPIGPYLTANSGRWNSYFATNAGAMHRSGFFMPIVATDEHSVINGLGRLQYAAEQHAGTVQIVTVPAERSRLAEAMLNCLTMDFAVHTRYADLLRHNSFRRAHHNKLDLGMAFLFDAFGLNINAKDIDMSVADNLRKWKQTYGSSVLDFGAGHLDDTTRLRKLGIACLPFEPYQTTGADIDKPKSRAGLLTFLDAISQGTRFDSIFQNSIMNSVPFLQDRQFIVQIIAALCSPKTTVHTCAASVNYHDYTSVRGRSGLDESSQSVQFRVDYEPHTIVAALHKLPKVQRYHTPAEWHGLWSIGFNRVRSTLAQNTHMVYAKCWDPKPISPAELRRAIEFEFNLPYPDESRMGLVPEALVAFSRRLGIDLANA